MKKIELSSSVTCKFIPFTNTLPARYWVKVRQFPSRFMSQHLVDGSNGEKGVEFPYIAQALAEMRIKELKLDWKIIAGTCTEDGEYIFITEMNVPKSKVLDENKINLVFGRSCECSNQDGLTGTLEDLIKGGIPVCVECGKDFQLVSTILEG